MPYKTDKKEYIRGTGRYLDRGVDQPGTEWQARRTLLSALRVSLGDYDVQSRQIIMPYKN